MKTLLHLLTICLLFVVFTGTASAHVLETDGSIGAILHVSPDDDPVMGVPTEFFFEFKDKSGKFQPKDCDCTASIVQSGKELYTQPLFGNNPNPSLEDASFTYSFSAKDMYEVKVVGKPRTEGAFEPFVLTWNIRVARESATNTTNAEETQPDWLSNSITYIVTLAGVIIFVGLMMSRKKQ